MLTETTMRVASHEAAHAALAHLLGLRIGYISRDPMNAGQTLSIFDKDDPRTVKQKAFDRAVIALGAVLVDPTDRIEACDADVVRATEYCALAGCSFGEVSDRAREVIATDAFRRIHRLFEGELIARPHLDASEVEELLR